MSTYVIVDLETTGLNPGRNGIIEFAALVLENGQVVDEFETLIQSFDPVSELVTEITGITQEMVDEAPSMFAVKKEIKRILGDHILVGHNVGFDIGFLQQEKLALTNRSIDTLTLTTILFPTLGRYNLEHVANALKLPLPEEGQAHRALADTEVTAELFMLLKEAALKLDLGVLSEIAEAGLRVNWPEAIFFQLLISEKAKMAFTQGGSAKRPGRSLGELFRPDRVEGKSVVPKEQEKVEEIPTEDILNMFEQGGNFSRVFPNFEYRPEQIEMVGAVCDAFNQGQHLLIEAGTGTGKSVGYMLPAAFWAAANGRRVVVSTNTINLQDQLVNKDVPTLQKVLPFELRTAIRKGRRNYLCTRIFQQLRHKGVDKVEEMPLYARLLVWLPQTDTGDMNEIPLRSFDERMMWNRMSAQNDICRQEHCNQFRCPRFVAQQRAEHAHIVIVNHALLLSDLANENHILPTFYDLIIDEAHHLEPAVTSGLSFEADKRTLDRLVNDIVREKGGLLNQLTGQTNIVPADIRSGLDSLVNRIRGDGDLAQMRMDDFFSTLTYFLTDGKRSKSDFSQQVRLTHSIRTQPLWDEVMISWDNL
ncbi:MAG: exonuclease domain-containing protein, partial [Chloroflexota bacterium]